VDGTYALERLLAGDVVAAAAVAGEGLTPLQQRTAGLTSPHRMWGDTAAHAAETGTILRAVIIGMAFEWLSRR
jgi:hypothetical protein